MKVIAFDPGKTTGVAWADLDGEWQGGRVASSEAVKSSWVDGSGGCKQIISGVSVGRGVEQGDDSENQMVWDILEMIAEAEPDVVVMEDFVLFPGKQHSSDRESMIPMRLNACVSYSWWLMRQEEDAGDMEISELVFQMPGERTIITDKRLHSWGLWRTPRNGGGPHAMDATRHLLVYARKIQARSSGGG